MVPGGLSFSKSINRLQWGGSYRSKKFLCVVQTDFTGWCCNFGSTVVLKKEINFKPKITTAEEHICSDGILCRKGIFCDWKGMLKLLLLAFTIRFRSNYAI